MSHPTPRYHASLRAPAAVMTIIPRQVQAMVVLLLVAVSLSLFLFVPHTLADEQMPEAPGSIAGVVRTASGTLQAGIQVTLFTPLGNVIQAFTTQADGAYRFWLLPAGIYRVGISDPQRIYAPLYYPAVPTLAKATNVSVAGNQVTGIDLTLQPAGQITGIITAALGFTLTSASVSLLQEIELSGNSFWQTIQTVNLPADGGVYTFTGLSADDYRICAIGYYFTLYKYECYDNVYTIERATSLTLTIGATVSNINLSLGDNADFAEIRGRVTTLTNEPLAGIEVYGMLIPSVGRSNTLARSTFPVPTFIPTSPPILDPAYGYSFATRTDKNGNYQLSGLEGGRYRLFFSEPTGAYAFEYYNDALTIEQATLIDVRPGQIISDVNVQLGLGSQIQGALTMLGQPPRDAYVTAEMKTPFGWQSIVNGRVQSDTGYYRIGGLSAGIYRMAAFSEVYDGSTIYFYRGYFGGNIADTARRPIVLSFR